MSGFKNWRYFGHNDHNGGGGVKKDVGKKGFCSVWP